MPLHLTKIAFGCATLDVLRARIDGRAADGSFTIETRYKPKRADELEGGSLFWIIAHRMVARQRILTFEEAEGGRCRIRLDSRLVMVVPRSRRAHQGWRYLEGGDAPSDLDGDGPLDPDALPPDLAGELSHLGLL